MMLQDMMGYSVIPMMKSKTGISICLFSRRSFVKSQFGNMESEYLVEVLDTFQVPGLSKSELSSFLWIIKSFTRVFI